MVEATYNFELAIPGRDALKLPNQSLTIGKEEYNHVDLDTDSNKKRDVTIDKIDGCNLLVIKVETPLPKDSKYQLQYAMSVPPGAQTAGAQTAGDQKEFKELDAPLFLVGSWIKTLFKSRSVLTFKLENTAEAAAKEAAKSAVTAKTEADTAKTEADTAKTEAAEAAADATKTEDEKKAAAEKAVEKAVKAAEAEAAAAKAAEKAAEALAKASKTGKEPEIAKVTVAIGWRSIA